MSLFHLLDGLGSASCLQETFELQGEEEEVEEEERGAQDLPFSSNFSWTEVTDTTEMNPPNNYAASISNDENENEDALSVGASSDTMSYGPSDVPLVGFPAGTLLEIYRESQLQPSQDVEESLASGTIVSSAPSTGGDPVFQNNSSWTDHFAWTLSPHPSLHVGQHAASITTTESVYRNASSLENSSVQEQEASIEDSSLLSLAPSTLLMDSSFEDGMSLDSSLTVRNLSFASLPEAITSSHNPRESQELTLVRHEPISFINAANRCLTRGRSLPPDETSTWFSHFTERDWFEFRLAADMILQALAQGGGLPAGSHHYSVPLLTLPPSVPQHAPNTATSDTSSQNVRTRCEPSEFLPETFLCAMCQDVIVGACALSCACSRSTVCTVCWEAKNFPTSEVSESGTITGGDYVWIESGTCTSCPSCQQPVENTVPCHALDVAILHAIENLSSNALPLQQAYYSRLHAWRFQVEERLAQESTDRATRHDQLLAELIQQEEEYFWNKKTRKQQYSYVLNRGMLFFGEVAVCVAVAAISSVGMNRIATSRR